jgi:hypothetical protein
MTHERSTTERRISSDFGPGVAPPHRPRPLGSEIADEGRIWAVESGPVGEAGGGHRHDLESGFVAGEGHAVEPDDRLASEATGYRTSPFIAGGNEERDE